MNPFDAYSHWLSHWSDIKAHVWHLNALARSKTTVLELGVRGGVSTSALLSGVIEGLGHMWSVDREYCGQLFDKTPQWTFIQADSCDKERIEKAGPPYLHEKIGMLFIDTEHTYDRTIRELDMWGPRVMRGGVIVLHDIYDLTTMPGVFRACMDYCNNHMLEMTIHPDSNGLAVIEVV